MIIHILVGSENSMFLPFRRESDVSLRLLSLIASIAVVLAWLAVALGILAKCLFERYVRYKFYTA